VGTEDVQVGALIVAIRRKSWARVRNAAKVPAYAASRTPDADGGRDELLLGDVALDVPLRVLLGEQLRLVESPTSPSSTTTSSRRVPVTVSASPKAVRVATLSPTS